MGNYLTLIAKNKNKATIEPFATMVAEGKYPAGSGEFEFKQYDGMEGYHLSKPHFAYHCIRFLAEHIVIDDGTNLHLNLKHQLQIGDCLEKIAGSELKAVGSDWYYDTDEQLVERYTNDDDFGKSLGELLQLWHQATMFEDRWEKIVNQALREKFYGHDVYYNALEDYAHDMIDRLGLQTPLYGKVFISYSHADKPFASRLAEDLKRRRTPIWIDDAEVKVGDSIVRKIEEGISGAQYLIVLLSKNSVESDWVRRELEIAVNDEMEIGSVKVLPCLIEECALPVFLKGRLYADFTTPEKYKSAFELLFERIKESQAPAGLRGFFHRFEASALVSKLNEGRTEK